MSALRSPRSSGKVRQARLTDLAALGELSRLCQSDGADTRSLGLPVNGPPIGVFSLFRLPLGAFRPNDVMFVYEEDGRIAGLVRVERNAFGRQLDSFEAELDVPVLGATPVHAVFIRAPIIERTGPDVDVLARLDDGRVVAVRQRNVLATAFHPELAGETRFHRLVATMASEFDDPGEGAGRRHHPTRRSLTRHEGSSR